MTQEGRGVQLVWSSLSGTQTSPGEGTLQKASSAVIVASHGDQGFVSRLPYSSTPCRLPTDPGAGFGCADVPADSFGHICTSLGTERWVTAGWTYLAASQFKCFII